MRKVFEIHYVCCMRLWCLLLVLIWSPFWALGQSYFLNGDATALGNDCYRVTANSDWQNGTVWYSDQLNLTQDFSLEFDMYFGTTDANGADGMAFVLQTVGTNAIGLSGGGMGYQGFNPSFGIEFDTFVNADVYDPNYDHVAFLRNGNIFHNSNDNLAGPVAATAGQTNIEDGQAHQVKITWDASTQLVSLFVDCQFRLSENIDLVNSIFQGNTMVYWGFTGATGGMFNEQRVCLDIVVNNTPNLYSVCTGEPVALAANGSLAGSVEWSPAADLDDPYSFTPTAFPTQSTTYCYTYTDFCGESTITCVEVVVIQPPTIVLDQEWIYCEGDTYTITATVTGGADILWSTVNGGFNGSFDGASVNVSMEGEYTVEAFPFMAECSASSSTSVVILPLPSFSPSPVNICPDEDVILEVPADYNVIAWWNGSNDPSVMVNQGGNYTVEIEENGCTDVITWDVDEWDVPLIDLGQDIEFCFEDQALVLDAGTIVTWSDGSQAATIDVSTSGVYQALWTDGNCTVSDEITVAVTNMPQVVLSGPNGFCLGDEAELMSSHSGVWSEGTVGTSILVNTEGQYAITVVDGPCETSETVQVSVWDVPGLELGPNVVLCDDQQVVLNAGDDDVSVAYEWSTGEISSSIDVEFSGWYYCDKSNLCGVVSDSIYIELIDCQSELFIPNSFTPNGDGINDIWYVTGVNVSDVRVQIFDRWGLLVFETTDMTKPWVGDYLLGTHFVPADVYHYLIRFVDINGDHLKKRGVISVIR
jgi:gliding motility-associated-like protein